MANPKDKPEKDQKTKEAKAEIVNPLKVEINFPSISKLKIVPEIDEEGALVVSVGFQARTNQYEVFRYFNLLRQQHDAIYATIGSNQSAMDFRFDFKGDEPTVTVIQSAKALPAGTAKVEQGKKKTAKEEKAEKAEEPESKDALPGVKIVNVQFNHMKEEKLPFGVAIDYQDMNGKEHTVAGRGKDPTAAVLEGIAKTGMIPKGLKEPFEISKALEEKDPSPMSYKLIRAIESGNFDTPEGGS